MEVDKNLENTSEEPPAKIQRNLPVSHWDGQEFYQKVYFGYPKSIMYQNVLYPLVIISWFDKDYNGIHKLKLSPPEICPTKTLGIYLFCLPFWGKSTNFKFQIWIQRSDLKQHNYFGTMNSVKCLYDITNAQTWCCLQQVHCPFMWLSFNTL